MFNVNKRWTRFRLCRSCLRPSAEHVSACGRQNEAPRRTREKTSGTQGKVFHLLDEIELALRDENHFLTTY